MNMVPDDVKLEMEGGRVTLSALRPIHVAALFETAKDPDTWAYMPVTIRAPDDIEQLVERALAAKQCGNEFPFVVIDRNSGTIVGSTRLLDQSPQNRSAEIGFTWIAAPARRTRINTECKYLLLKYAFETLKLIRVQIKTDSRNLRSQNAIERIGFVKEGVLRRHRILPDGYVRDSVYYSMIAEEWPQASQRLRRMLDA